MSSMNEPPEVHIPYSQPLTPSLIQSIKDRLRVSHFHSCQSLSHVPTPNLAPPNTLPFSLSLSHGVKNTSVIIYVAVGVGDGYDAA